MDLQSRGIQVGESQPGGRDIEIEAASTVFDGDVANRCVTAVVDDPFLDVGLPVHGLSLDLGGLG